MARLLVGLIKLYQYALSPFLGRSCRFTPTCSEYACQCLTRHGFFKGIWLGAKRIAKCHPWHPGGYDPAP